MSSRIAVVSVASVVVASVTALSLFSVVAPRNSVVEKQVRPVKLDDVTPDRPLHLNIEDLLTFLRSNAFIESECGPVLKDVFHQAFRLDPRRLDPAELREHGVETVRNLFLIRLAVRARLAQFASDGDLDPVCVSGVRDTLRAARVLEDYLSEFFAGYPEQSQKPPRAFQGSFPWLQFAPGVSALELRSGDVFLSRGTAFTSAAIARIADDDSNFSHLAILHIDEKTGERSMVEAHIEVGSTIQSFDSYASDGKARAILFRHADAALAHAAAKGIYERVRRNQDAGQNICYDFGMDLKSEECLFCSEIVAVGYRSASRGGLEIPAFPSRISVKNRDFLGRIGVKGSEIFAPADIELDPRFELIAEWRDLGRTHLLHMHDAVLTAIFDWMERLGYVLMEPATTQLKKHAAWHLRRWPLFGDYLFGKKFPTNMSTDTIGAVATLDEVASALLARLQEANVAHRKKAGFWLTPRQMLEELERIRIEDARSKEPAFHAIFRPR